MSRRLMCAIVSVVRRPSVVVNFSHFRLLRNRWTEFSELGRTQDLNVLYQVCVFSDWSENKIAVLASDWLRHFSFSSETAEQNPTKFDRKQDLNVFYQVLFFLVDRKTRWPPCRPLIGRDIFDFSSETNERNSTKLDRKQDLNGLYMSVGTGGHRGHVPPPPPPIILPSENFPYSVCTLIKEIGA